VTRRDEAITHIAFYAGSPNAMTAITTAKGVFEEQSTSSSSTPTH
jgi:alkylhydroperoxidase/carboxymuconolactone decarboxylase family protein YurZ